MRVEGFQDLGFRMDGLGFMASKRRSSILLGSLSGSLAYGCRAYVCISTYTLRERDIYIYIHTYVYIYIYIYRGPKEGTLLKRATADVILRGLGRSLAESGLSRNP